MIKHDKEMLWRPGYIYIPAWQFSGLDYEATTATDIKSMGTGSANDTAIVEVNTSGVTALRMGAALNSVEHFMLMPGDLDRMFPIYFRTWWTANNTSGDATWKVLYKAIVPDTTVLGTAVAATALDKAIALDPMAGVAYTIMRSPEGRVNGSAIADTAEALQIDVSIAALTTITTPFFLGLEIRYTPKMLQGGSSLREAKAALHIGSNKY